MSDSKRFQFQFVSTPRAYLDRCPLVPLGFTIAEAIYFPFQLIARTWRCFQQLFVLVSTEILPPHLHQPRHHQTQWVCVLHLSRSHTLCVSLGRWQQCVHLLACRTATAWLSLTLWPSRRLPRRGIKCCVRASLCRSRICFVVRSRFRFRFWFLFRFRYRFLSLFFVLFKIYLEYLHLENVSRSVVQKEYHWTKLNQMVCTLRVKEKRDDKSVDNFKIQRIMLINTGATLKFIERF